MTGAINFVAGKGITYSVSGGTYAFSAHFTTTGVTGITSAFVSDYLLLERSKGFPANTPGQIVRIRVDDLTKSLYSEVSPSDAFTLVGQKMLLGSNLQINSNTAITEILSGAVTSLNGLTGGITLEAGSNITLTPVGNTITIASSGGNGGNIFTYGLTASAGSTQGDRWMDSDNGIEYVYVNDGTSNQWVQPTSSGLIGATGSQGIQGIQGVTGATGPQGNTGTNGTIGINGNTGATGATGPQGVTGAIAFTASTTAPAGATYGDMWFNTTSGNMFVYITDGTSSYWVEPFGPQGATGANGTSGTNGATGATGPQGVTGATGPVGDYVISVNGQTGAVEYIVDLKRGWFLS